MSDQCLLMRQARPIGALVAIMGFALLAGCQGYEVSVNDRQVYSPTPLYTGFQTADHNLQQCIDQHIEDQRITRAGQLLRLRCSHAGISSLAGIEHFAALTELDLSDNKLQDIVPVTQLGRLVHLNLANNRISDADPLLALVNLQTLDVQGNPEIACDTVMQLAQSQNINPALPRHCRGE